MQSPFPATVYVNWVECLPEGMGEQVCVCGILNFMIPPTRVGRLSGDLNGWQSGD